MRALALSLLISVLQISAVHAEKMDVETHTLVINKLERVLEPKGMEASARAPIHLRLGDLYAERARLQAMAEIEKGCDKPCLGSDKDRKAALTHYKAAFSHSSPEQQEKMLLQMAHLSELIDQTKEAEKLYLSIVKNSKKHSKILVGQAYIGLGDLAYRQGRFAQAKNYFQSALQIEETPKKGYVTYRLAWCYLNLGEQGRAVDTLVGLLKNPELLEDSGRIEKSFHADVARDLATFLARGNLGRKEIDLLISLSPENTAKENVHYLATEADRIGKRQSAVLAWAAFNQFETTPFDRLEAQIRMAQLEYDMNRPRSAVQEMETAVKMWREQGCDKKEECDILKKRLRSLVTEWNKAEKSKPTKNLLKAYLLYTDLFHQDIEMHFWAAQVARSLSQWSQSIDLYSRAAKLSAGQKDHKIIFEGSLLGQIEVAEITRQIKAREDAYNQYLRMNPKGEKVLEVRYQLAHILYEKKQYKKAAQAFTTVALVEDQKQIPLRKKAADLALDSLALEKEDTLIEKWATEFSTLFKKDKSEFLSIARRAVLRQVAAAVNNPKTSTSQLKDMRTKLSNVSLLGADNKEKILVARNKILLAEKLKDINDVEKSADAMLQTPGLSEEDREFALERKVWAAELKLDFKTAYNLSRKMKLKNLSETDRLLRLGLLAELSFNNPDPYYRKFIDITKSRHHANLIRAKLIRKAKNPWRELNANIKYLKSTPTLLGSLALEIFAETRDYKAAQALLNNKSLGKTPGLNSLQRIVFFKEYSQFKKEISSHRLRSNSNYLVQKTLKQRLALLERADQLANKAVKTRDWTLQLLTLDILQTENDRLAKEIVKLPAPAGLKKKEQAEYKNLLTQQAKPFAYSAAKYQKKLDEFWANTKAIESLFHDYENSSYQLSRLVAEELTLLKNVAPNRQKKLIAETLSERKSRPSRSQILTARAELRSNPFDVDQIQKLRELEKNAGGETMVAYLDARMAAMNKGVRQ